MWFVRNRTNGGLFNAKQYEKDANCKWLWDTKAVQKHDSGVASRLFVVSTRNIKNEELFVSYGSRDFATRFVKKAVKNA